MSKKVIAVVRLQPGEAGYYDELSRIHLTIGHPEAHIYAGTNCEQLRRSVQSGRLRLVSGSFGEPPQPFRFVRKGEHLVLAHNTAPAKEEPVKEEEVKETVEAVKEEPVVEAPAEEVVEEPAVAEEVAEEAPVVEEAPVEEKKPARRTRRARKTTAKE